MARLITALLSTNKTFSFSAQDAGSSYVQFKSDGLKMYMVGLSNDVVYQYTLSTAWDVSTASYDSVSFSIASQTTECSSINFSSDGTKFYINDSTADVVHQYALSTAWDLSTASYASKSFSVASQTTSLGASTFNPDGTALYVSSSASAIVYKYNLSTAWDISSASYSSESVNLSGTVSSPIGLQISTDGTALFIGNSSANTIFEFTLSTAWNITTATYTSRFVNIPENLGNFILKASDTRIFNVLGFGTTTISSYAFGEIGLVAQASTPVDSSTATNTANPTAVTPPSGLIAGDLVLMIGQQRAASATLSVSQAGGQTWTSETAISTTNQTARVFWCVFNGTWTANPSVSFGATVCNTVTMHVLRYATLGNYTWAVNKSLVELDIAAASTQTITGQTTTGTAPTITIAGLFTADDNTLNLATSGWSASLIQQFRNTSGSDQSSVFAFLSKTGAGATGNVSFTQLTLGNDAATSFIITFSATSSNALETPANGSLTLAGQAPTIIVTNNTTIAPAAGVLAVTGQTPRIPNDAIVTQVAVEVLKTIPSAAQASQVAVEVLKTIPSVAQVTQVAIEVLKEANRVWTANATITGFAPILGISKTATPSNGALTLAGQTPTILATDNRYAVVSKNKQIEFVGGKSIDTKLLGSGAVSVSLTDLTGGLASAPAAGDTVVVFHHCSALSEAGVFGVTTSGYTQTLAWDGGEISSSVSVKSMGGTPDTTVTVTNPAASYNRAVTTIMVFRGVDPTTPIDVTSVGIGVGVSALPDPPSITPVTEGAVVLGIGGVEVTNGYSGLLSASDLTSFFVNKSGTTTQYGICAGLGYYRWSGSGAVDLAVWSGETGNQYIAGSVVLRPEAITSPLITGQSPSVKLDVVLSTGAGAVIFTGQQPSVGTSKAIDVSAGALTVTGAAPTDVIAVFALPAVDPLAITGYIPVTKQSVYALPAVASVVITGAAPTLFSQVYALPAVKALTLTGAAPVALVDNIEALPGAVLTITGQTPALIEYKVLSPAVKALTLTGAAPSLLQGNIVYPAVKAVTITGAAPTIPQQVFVQPGAGALAETGQSVSILQQAYVYPAAGSVTFAGAVPTIPQQVFIQPAVRNLTLTGAAPLVIQNAIDQTGAGAVSITGAAPSIRQDAFMLPAAKAVVLAGQTPVLKLDMFFQTGAGALAVTGQATSAELDYTIAIGDAALAISGAAPQVIVDAVFSPRVVNPLVGSVALSGGAVVVTTGMVKAPAAGALAITGAAPTLRYDLVASPAAGAIVASGYQAALRYDLKATPAAGAVTATGYAPAIKLDIKALSAAGSLVATGAAPALRYDLVASTAAASVTVTGVAPALRFDIKATTGAGAVIATGVAPSLRYDFKVLPDSDVLALTGEAPALYVAVRAVPNAGAVSLAGAQPTITVNSIELPASGTVALSGQAPAIREYKVLSPATKAVVITGEVPSAATSGGIQVGTGSLTTTGQALYAVHPEYAITSSGTTTLVGQAPSLRTDIVLSPSAGQVQFTPYTPDGSVTRVLSVSSGTLGFAGIVPVVVANNTTETPVLAGAVTIEGQPVVAAIGEPQKLGELRITGQPVTLLETYAHEYLVGNIWYAEPRSVVWDVERSETVWLAAPASTAIKDRRS